MQVYISNNDPFGNYVSIVDKNASDAVIWNRVWLEADATAPVTCQENDSGFGNIATKTDNTVWTGRSFLHEGDTVYLF